MADENRRRPLPPEIKAANRARALELVAERGDRPMTPEFAAAMRTVFLPAYRQVLADEAAARRDDDTA